MNYGAIMSQLQQMSKDDIVQSMQSGSIPGWMGLARLQEMKGMQGAATEAPPSTSIAQERAIGMAGGGPVTVPRYQRWWEDTKGWAGDVVERFKERGPDIPGQMIEDFPPFHSTKRFFDYLTEDVPAEDNVVKPVIGAGGAGMSFTPPLPKQASVAPPMPIPPAPPSGIDALKEQLAGIDSAPSAIPGSPMQMSDFSYLKEMMPGAIDPTEQLDARRADAMEQKDNAKWMGLLQFGAGLSGPGSWSENLSEAGTGLNQVYGERMAAYHQAMQDIEKEALSAQFQNADLASRNVNSGIALGNLEQNQRQALATDERERLGIGLREKEARRRDAIEMSKLEEMAARTAASIKIAEMRTGQRGGMKAKDLSAEARALAEQFVDENAVYETDEERAMAVQKAYIKAYEMLTNMYGLDSGADVTDLGDDY